MANFKLFLIYYYLFLVGTLIKALLNFKKFFLKRHTKNSQRLLIVFINAIGDFVIFSSILKGIREKYKDYEISLIGFERWKELTKNISFVDNYIFLDRNGFVKNILQQYKIIKLINENEYEIAIHPPLSKPFLGDLLIKFSNSKQKISFNSNYEGLPNKIKLSCNKIYDVLIEPDLRLHKEIDHYFYLAKFLGIKEKHLHLPKIILNKEEEIRSKNILQSTGIKKREKFVVLHPGAASKKRIWPIINYISICNYLNQLGYKILITGSKSEKILATKIQDKLNYHVYDLTGKTNLMELAAIYKRASFYLGSDTGPLHIAMAVGLPTICILGGGHPFRFYPYGNIKKHRAVFVEMSCYGCNWNCIHNEIKCIKNITPEKVIDEINFLIQNQIICYEK